MLNWQIKAKTKHTMTGDVSIRKGKTQGKKNLVNISFNKRVHLKITDNQRIVFAIEGTRLYFAKSDDIHGWKLSIYKDVDGKPATSFFKVAEKILPLSLIEEGDYNLEFDANEELYYIDVQHKLGKSRLMWNGKRF